jgi:hypothetical protein
MKGKSKKMKLDGAKKRNFILFLLGVPLWVRLCGLLRAAFDPSRS